MKLSAERVDGASARVPEYGCLQCCHEVPAQIHMDSIASAAPFLPALVIIYLVSYNTYF